MRRRTRGGVRAKDVTLESVQATRRQLVERQYEAFMLWYILNGNDHHPVAAPMWLEPDYRNSREPDLEGHVSPGD